MLTKSNSEYTISGNTINLKYVDLSTLFHIALKIENISEQTELLVLGLSRGYYILCNTGQPCTISGIHYDSNCTIRVTSGNNITEVVALSILYFHYK